jgi:methionyl aminopeptidase
MNQEELKSWKIAGRIAAEAIQLSETLVKENTLLIDINNKIEEFIIKKGAKPAFPVNLSLNNIAAHYTAIPNDLTTLKAGDLLKVDIGVVYEGCVGDTAKSIEIKTKDNKDLIKSSEEARNNVIKILRPGIKLFEIGSVIEETIKSYGFKPIKNLSGHGLEKYTIHSPPTISNYDSGEQTKLHENQIIAIEPFASTGMGFIKEGKPSTIYKLNQIKPTRNQEARKLLIFIQGEFKTLPFSKLQLTKLFKSPSLNLALNTLEKENILYQYNHLPEQTPNSIVSQSEHTIIIQDKPIVTTKLD